MAWSLLLFAACTQDDALLRDSEPADADEVLSIQRVGVEEFMTEGTTRVANDGVSVRFEAGNSLEDENGDVIGLLLMDEAGEAFANVPFKYIFQDGQNRWVNRDGVAYTGKMKKAIAYFPYAEMAKLPSSVEELKQTKLEQNNAETEFKNKDLLVAEMDIDSYRLPAIEFEHAFSLVTFSGENTLTVGDETISYLLDLSDVVFSIGDKQYTPEPVNGRYLCLLDGGELKTNEFRYSYTVNGVPYIKTVGSAKALRSNYSYAFACPASAGAAEGMAYGDFYCTTAGGQTVVLPGNAASVPEQLTCQGVVFHVMDADAFGVFCTTNGLVAADYAGYNGAHGLMVSLKDGGRLNTADQNTWSSILPPVEGADSRDILNGYKLTQAAQAAVGSGALASFTALENHEEAVKDATAWYLSSFAELKYLIQGETPKEGSTAGQEYINRQFDKAGGKRLEGNFPSVTFDNGFCIMQNGGEMGWHGVPDGEFCRPVCAF